LATQFIVDTDVVIDYLRSRSQAVDWLDSVSEQISISVVSVAELFSGVREGRERVVLEKFLAAFEILSVDEHVARIGGLYRRDYGKSHGVGLADALIAATAEVSNSTLVTLNDKHFPMLKNVLVPYKKQ
jgi:predicted nucleic acid-binding protein